VNPQYTFILNPAAAKGKVRKLIPAIERMLQESGLSYVLVQTGGEGDARRIAEEAQSRFVVAIGGDGTINETANGLIGTEKVLGILPAGSGNDFIKSVGIPHSLEEALARLHNPEVRSVDVGTVLCGANVAGSMTPRFFMNGVGVGFDAAVAARTQQIPWLTGTALYLVAVLQTLWSYEAPEFEVSVDDVRWTRRLLLTAIGNGHCAGGGFFLTPKAVVDDGILDVTAIEQIGIPKILRLMPRVMRGKEIKDPALQYLRVKKITMRGDRPFMVHADGEVVGRNVQEVQIGLHEKRLDLAV
jgi:diacylglycerol kinase (ATP)